ncbi:sugar phosphate isomerase/epimerase family protein [Halobaculum lipolyticum]|uniref:Sugar phosphate isomerase/epimerase family protein n=1 Tax=Halobaculum lipolyticum TaxID=3032001 RepID=A0ABD5W9J1_9EURY|nr:sugar phosphate isomerase/epimerase [Halobaculum sp. DT31]
MPPKRRDVLKATGGTVALGAGAAGVEAGLDDGGVREQVQQQQQGEPELLASYWAHAGDVKPFTGRQWSPWDLENRVEMLADVGFTGIGLFHEDIQHMVEEEGRTLTEIGETIRDAGLDTIELEFLVSWLLPEDDPRRQAEQETRQLLLDAAEAMDARHIKIGNIDGIPVETSALADRFATFCSEAAAVDTQVGMEILPPDPNARTIEQALEWVSGPDNGGLFLDTWHVTTIETISYDDVAALSSDDITAVELDDGFLDTGRGGFVENTVNMRRVPGYGDFDVPAFVEACREAGFTGPWGTEILSEEYRRRGMESAYTHTYEGTAAALAEAGGAGDGAGTETPGDDGTETPGGDGTATPGGDGTGTPDDTPDGTQTGTPDGTRTGTQTGTPTGTPEGTSTGTLDATQTGTPE